MNVYYILQAYFGALPFQSLGILLDSSSSVVDAVSSINALLAHVDRYISDCSSTSDISDVRELVGTSLRIGSFLWSKTHLAWMRRCDITVPLDTNTTQVLEKEYRQCADSTSRCKSNSGTCPLSRFLEALVQSDQWIIEVNSVWQTMNCKFLREIVL